MIDENYILEIYKNKVKLPPSYFKKYEKVPNCPIQSWNYEWGDHDFPRVWSVLDFKEWMNKYKINIDNLGCTCNSDPEIEFIQPKNKHILQYPPNDLHTLNISNFFDFFIFNQTIEHLHNPFLAVKNIYNSLKINGYVFTSVPTINIPHSTPIHFNGYNPMGLAMLFINCGFEVIEIGQWGNYNYIKQLWDTHMWPGYNQLNIDGFVPNEEKNVCQCWILAQKKK